MKIYANAKKGEPSGIAPRNRESYMKSMCIDFQWAMGL